MPEADLTIIYDGDCPFCRRYVELLRLRESAGTVELINARERPDLTRQFRLEGIPLDEGMVVRMGGKTWHGADALHVLALLSTPSGFFNRVNRFIFRWKLLSFVLYPLLRMGRSVTLAILGIRKIDTGDAGR